MSPGYKSLVAIVFMLSWCENSLSQNLVPNPSFECGTEMCDADNNPTLFEQWACAWEAPTTGTPDIFSKNLNCAAVTPNSIFSFLSTQSARTGSRFAGVYTFQEGRTHREYMEVKLTERLVPGEYYCARMYVSRAAGMKYSANNMAMYFGDLPPGTESMNLISVAPQIESHNVITSTAWYEISGSFIASSSSDNLVIGNFEDDSNTQLVQDGGPDSNSNSIVRGAYYFVDDVSVERVPHKLTFSGITTICQNDQTNIVVNHFWDDVYWTTMNDTSTVVSSGISLSVKPKFTTTYRVKVNKCEYQFYDTITVHVKPSPVFYLGRDTTLCLNQTLSLDAGPGFTSYQWQDLSSAQTYFVTKPGMYIVRVGNNLGCITTQSVNVIYEDVPVANLGKDSLICETFYALYPGHADSYEWSTGVSDSVFTPNKSGKYWVTLRNQCGIGADTIQLFSQTDLFVPNILTINVDTKNEHLRFKGIGNTFQATVKIFNRWGDEIFSKKNYRDEWPPQNDIPASGSYYAVIEFAGCRPYKGWIEIIK